jgi:ribosomal-protein-alanine N-acetyltransferase
MAGKLIINAVLVSMAPALATMHAESFGRECWSLKQIQGSLAQPATRAWMACEGDVATGFIFCQMMPPEAEILTFCVNPARRQHGIGAALLGHALESLRAEGGRKMFLEVAADNSAARKLYERFGFTVTGTRANYYKRGVVTVDAVMYEYDGRVNLRQEKV